MLIEVCDGVDLFVRAPEQSYRGRLLKAISSSFAIEVVSVKDNGVMLNTLGRDSVAMWATYEADISSIAAVASTERNGEPWLETLTHFVPAEILEPWVGCLRELRQRLEKSGKSPSYVRRAVWSQIVLLVLYRSRFFLLDIWERFVTGVVKAAK